MNYEYGPSGCFFLWAGGGGGGGGRGDRGGLLVEYMTQEREVLGSIPTSVLKCLYTRHFKLPRAYVTPFIQIQQTRNGLPNADSRQW